MFTAAADLNTTGYRWPGLMSGAGVFYTIEALNPSSGASATSVVKLRVTTTRG